MTIQILIFQSIYSAHKNNFLVSNFPMQPTSFAVFGGRLQTVQSFPKAALDAATHWLHFIGPTAFYCQTNGAILGGFHCIYTFVEIQQWRKGYTCSRPRSADILWSTDIGNLSKMTADWHTKHWRIWSIESWTHRHSKCTSTSMCPCRNFSFSLSPFQCVHMWLI